jgi:hypothetical protein
MSLLQEPELVNGLLAAIQSISDEAKRALADPELPRQSLLSALSVSCLFFSSQLRFINHDFCLPGAN